MSQLPDAVWVNANPSFRKFDQPLINRLSKKMAIAEWQYHQTVDEPASPAVAVKLLQDYLQQYTHPLHLIGHGTGGLVSLLYAHRYPKRIKSLTLLSVGAHPTVDWQAHYYVQLNLLLCSRETLLTQMVYSLFGRQSRSLTRRYQQVLERDLLSAASPHSLYQRVHHDPQKVSVPLLVCCAEHDPVIDPNLWRKWQPWLKDGDRLWQCPNGRYFFHYTYPEQVYHQIQAFWQSLTGSSSSSFQSESVEKQRV